MSTPVSKDGHGDPGPGVTEAPELRRTDPRDAQIEERRLRHVLLDGDGQGDSRILPQRLEICLEDQLRHEEENLWIRYNFPLRQPPEEVVLGAGDEIRLGARLGGTGGPFDGPYPGERHDEPYTPGRQDLREEPVGVTVSRDLGRMSTTWAAAGPEAVKRQVNRRGTTTLSCALRTPHDDDACDSPLEMSGTDFRRQPSGP